MVAKTNISLLVGLLVSSLVTLARAEEPERLSAPSTKGDGPRLRLGVAGGLAVGAAQGSWQGVSVDAGVAAPSLDFDIGVQVDRRFAIFLHTNAATSLLTNQAAAYITAEYNPSALISLGTGVGYDAMALLWAGGCGTCRSAWSGVSVPLFLGLNFSNPDQFHRGGRRNTLRLTTLFAGGMEPGTGVFGAHGTIGLGGAWM